MLIEDADGASQWAVKQLLERERYDVALCGGPASLAGRCPMITDGRCGLVEGTDVVLNNLRLDDEPNRALLAAFRAQRPETAVIVEVTPAKANTYAEELAGFRQLREPAFADELSDAVEAAFLETQEAHLAAGLDPGHLVRVRDHVELPFGAVVALLQSDEGNELLAAALDHAQAPGTPTTSVTCGAFTSFGRGIARADLAFEPATDALGGARAVDLTALEVQSGRQPLTELALTTRGVEDKAGASASAERFLDRLTALLQLRSPQDDRGAASS